MNYKNKQLLSRMIFLGVFGLVILGFFGVRQYLAKSQDADSVGSIVDEFVSKEEGVATLVEFSDFQCPACGFYYPLVRELKKEFGDKLVVVYKHFPLKTIHKNAELAGRASEAALNQGKFGDMHNIIFEKQKEWSDSDQARSLFTAYAVSLGLDQVKFLADLDSDAVADKVSNDYQKGVSLKIRGIPTFFLDGKKINNPSNYEEFAQIIRQSIEP